MDSREEIRNFLATRRARLTIEQANLPDYGGRRRVPGLRREEVALLAGVSVDYYTRLERGNLSGVSDTVLDGVARALQLDEAERAHLFDLARTATSPVKQGAPTRSAQSRVRPSLHRVLESITGAPAYIGNARADILAANDLGRALFSEILEGDGLSGNVARYMFLDPRSHDFYLDWSKVANDTVAAMRGEAGRNPFDKALSDLVGELSTRSDEFRTRWAKHNVRLHRTAIKRLHHAVVGDLEVTADLLDLPGDGLALVTYTTEPASPSREAMNFLASWAAERTSSSKVE